MEILWKSFNNILWTADDSAIGRINICGDPDSTTGRKKPPKKSLGAKRPDKIYVKPKPKPMHGNSPICSWTPESIQLYITWAEPAVNLYIKSRYSKHSQYLVICRDNFLRWLGSDN